MSAVGERPDPAGEQYLWGTREHRARIDAECADSLARIAEQHRAREAHACIAEVPGWAPPGGVCRCERRCVIVLGPVGPLCEHHAPPTVAT